MRRVVFAIDQKQDFFLSLAFARLLRRRHPHSKARLEVLLLGGWVDPEFEPYLDEFDAHAVLAGPWYPRRLRDIPPMARRTLRFRRAVRGLALREEDVLVAYSWREFVVNALIGSLRVKPVLVRVRNADEEGEKLLTRRRRVVSAYWNAWNVLFGHSRQRYRWLATSNRTGAGRFLDDPYDHEFRVAAERLPSTIPWPLAVLREGSAEAGARAAVVVLGEIYPLAPGRDEASDFELLSGQLRLLRDGLPGHRLVFKPRPGTALPPVDLEGWEVAWEDVVMHTLLIRHPEIERVVSVKSSGSVLAGLYGSNGYLTYRQFGFREDVRAALDKYFAPNLPAVTVVERPEDLLAPSRPGVDAEGLGEACAPLLDLLAGTA